MIKSLSEVREKVDIPTDLAPIELQTVNIYKSKGEGLMELASSFIVETPEQANDAYELLKSIQAFEGSIKKYKDTFKKPVIRLGKLIDSVFKEASKPTEDAKSIIKEKILEFNRGIEKAKNELREDFKVKGIYKTRKWRIIDRSKIPAQYFKLELREEKVSEAMKNGEYIEGIEYYFEEGVK